ncbi:MAG: 2-phospho-L-lactate guanylyltransferase [Thaumarchaeota archaeon]|nr:2-phospho-L-lactate guanylyltransferase [Nitrososphaerota archaeon]
MQRADADKVGTRLHVVIPVKSSSKIKTRLSTLLKPNQRRTLNLLTLRHIMNTVVDSGQVEDLIVVSPDRTIKPFCKEYGAFFLQEEKDQGVNAAVAKGVNYCMNKGASSSLVIPSDLPCITTTDILNFAKMADEPRIVVITPSMRLDGTNVLLRKPLDVIETYYDQNSFSSHIREAQRANVKLVLYLSRTVMLDLDTEGDIALFLEQESQTEVHSYLTSIFDKTPLKKKPRFIHPKSEAVILEVNSRLKSD